MNCEQLRAMLDAYIDGELSDSDARALEAHAATCENCARELAAAKLVRDALAELPDEAAVPLNVQAGWRSAVRAEAKRRANRRRLRVVYAAAAALVLVLGATALLRVAPQREDAGPMTAPNVARIAAMPTEAVVARDGGAAEEALVQDEVYDAWKKYDAEDFDAACATVEALAQEYSGAFTVDAEQGVSVYRVELPREYLEDFLSAVSHIGTERDSEAMDVGGETALVYIQIDQP